MPQTSSTDSFKTAFSFKSTSRKRYLRREGKVMNLMTTAFSKLDVLEQQNSPHVETLQAELEALRSDVGDIRGVATENPGTAYKRLFDVKVRLRNVDAVLQNYVGSIVRAAEAGDPILRNEIAVHKKQGKHVYDVARQAQLDLTAFDRRVKGLGNDTVRARLNDQITEWQFEMLDINDMLMDTDNSTKSAKKAIARYKAMIKRIKAETKNIASLESNRLETSLVFNGQQVVLDSRALPGLTKKSEAEKEAIVARITQKITEGAELLEQIKGGPPLPEPSKANVASMCWYMKTMAEMSVGEPHEKGAINLPDDGNELRAWLDQCERVYNRESSHIKARQLNETDSNETVLEENFSTGGEDGSQKARGIDFSGTVNDTDTMLPYGMSTVLFQSFNVNDQERLYLKFETEGSSISLNRTIAAAGIGATLFGGIVPGLIGGALGGLAGLCTLSLKNAKEWATTGALVGAGPSWVLGGLVTDMVTLGGTRFISHEANQPRARASGGTDHVTTIKHFRNLVVKSKDTMAGYRESLKEEKNLDGEKIKHPVQGTWMKIQDALRSFDHPDLVELASGMRLQKIKHGQLKKSGISEINQMIGYFERIEDAIEAINPEDLTDKDVAAVDGFTLAVMQFYSVLDYKYGFEDTSVRLGDEAVIDDALGGSFGSISDSGALAFVQGGNELVKGSGKNFNVVVILKKEIDDMVSRTQNYVESIQAFDDETRAEEIGDYVLRSERHQFHVEDSLTKMNALLEKLNSPEVQAFLDGYDGEVPQADRAEFTKQYDRLCGLLTSNRDLATRLIEQSTSIPALHDGYCRQLGNLQLELSGDISSLAERAEEEMSAVLELLEASKAKVEILTVELGAMRDRVEATGPDGYETLVPELVELNQKFSAELLVYQGAEKRVTESVRIYEAHSAAEIKLPFYLSRVLEELNTPELYAQVKGLVDLVFSPPPEEG